MGKKLKICILQTHLPSDKIKSGGEERFTEGLAKNLGRRHKVFILTKGESDKTNEKGNITTVSIRGSSLKFLRYFIHVYKLWKNMKKIREFDVIQANISDTSNGIAGVLLSKSRRKPLITRVAGLDPVENIGFFKRFALRYIFKNSSLVVSINSNYLKNDIQKIWPESKIVVLPHGIEEEKMKRPKKLKSGRAKELVFVGRLVWFKNVGMALKAMRELQRRIKDIRLTIVGKGPEEGLLKSLTKTLEVGKNVTFRGERDNKHVQKILHESDVFVFPSKREPRGLVLIEAMANGLPIVAVNEGGPKDIIIPARNGFLVGIDDHIGMANRIMELLKNKKLYEQISKNNISDAKKYTWDKTAKAWEETYYKVLSETTVGFNGS